MRWIVAAALMLTGCAQNAILEVELDLPASNAAAADVRYVVVQGRSGEVDFATEWAGGGIAGGLELAPASQTVVVGIEADDSNEITDPLSLRIRYCRDETCTDPGDDDVQEVRVRIARAFYQGEYTELAKDLITLPPVMACTSCPVEGPIDIEKCDVRGCREGDTAYNCTGDDVHFCEE